jgi:hypothetical protein
VGGARELGVDAPAEIRRDDGAEHGDAERDAHLTAGGGDCGGDACAGGIPDTVVLAIGGLTSVPPRACSTRKQISIPRLGASAHASDPSENSASPVWKMRRRPRRSAVEPGNISRLASTSV